MLKVKVLKNSLFKDKRGYYWTTWRKGDVNTIDRYGPDGLAKLIQMISSKAVNFQSGYLYHYAFVMLIGFSLLLTFLILY